MSWLLVALWAAVGAPLRYVAGSLLDGGLPRGTILVNWVGSLVLGWCTGLGLSGNALALLGTASAAASRRSPRSPCRPTTGVRVWER